MSSAYMHHFVIKYRLLGTNMQKESTVIIGVIIIIFIVGYLFLSKAGTSTKQSGITSPTSTREVTNPLESQPTPIMTIDKTKTYQAILKTSAGTITIDLFTDKTPITVNNFVTLANKKFYNKTIFHRVIKGFMIQGGDPKGDGTGGPGYKFDDEKFDGEYDRGTVAMANAGPNTNGSQFFIMHQKNQIQKNYVIFGKVSAGLAVVDKIANSKVEAGPNGEGSTQTTPTVVTTVEIVEK